MIDRGHRPALSRQAEMLGISRGSLYYDPFPVSVADLAVIRRIDEWHLDYPFAGSRMLSDLLRGEGISIGRERVVTMKRRMGIEAIYPAAYVKTRRWAQGLSLPAAQRND
jgi:putative transposase